VSLLIPKGPINDIKNNTGLREASQAMASLCFLSNTWNRKNFHKPGTGGRNAMADHVYYSRPSYNGANALPDITTVKVLRYDLDKVAG